MLDVALLGTGGVMPLPNRFLTSLFIRCNGDLFLIDCGEGTQVTMKLLGWGYKQIGVICFTHFHADHISGLPGLLLAIANAGRTEPIVIIGPPGLKKVVESLCIITPQLPFSIRFEEICGDNNSFRFDSLVISTLPVFHRVPCFAYGIALERQGKFDVTKAREMDLPVQYWSLLQKGMTVVHEGREVRPEEILGASRKGIKVCYATDLRPSPKVSQFVAGADLFICEGLYGDDEKKEKAAAYRHCLFSEAAQMARDGNVKEMWLTHYSPSLTNPEEYIDMATGIFPNAMLGKDRMQCSLSFENEES